MGNCRVLLSKNCRITQPFHYAGQDGWTYYHGGIDLVKYYSELDYIIAHTAGVVIGAEYGYTGPVEDGSYGNYLWIYHENGYSLIYAHLAYGTIRKNVGDWCDGGEIIAYMNNTGHSYGSHLHWELRKPAGERINPAEYLNANLPNMGAWVKYINGSWVYTYNGVIDYSYTGIAPNENGWWRIVKGRVDFSFTGLAKNEYGWWYCKDGKVDFGYYGIVKNEYGWWKVIAGKVDFDYNGLAENEYGWWMLQKGKVDFEFNGLVPNENGIWVVKDGKVNFDYKGDYRFSNKIYKISGGKVS